MGTDRIPGATWLPGVGRSMNVDGRRFMNWHSTENDPSASAHSIAEYLIGKHYEPHVVWNPWSGEIVQMLHPTVGGSVLAYGNFYGSVNLGVECIGRAGVVGMRPLYDSPMRGFEQIMAWARSWGVPDVWPAGAPLPYPQAYGASNPQRRLWGASGHYGHSQWPGNEHGDPGLTRTQLWTGASEMLNVPTIRYGMDVGHPAMEAVVTACIDAINPNEHIETKDATRKQDVIRFFQVTVGLEGDGLVGPLTYAQLVEHAANRKY